VISDPKTMMRHTLGLVVGLAFASAVAEAQGVRQAPDPDQVRLRLGPLLMNPVLSLTNAGIDTNVFNESEDARPKRDFTITVTPRSDFWLRLGRTWLTGAVREDIVWFKKYTNQRSVNNRYSVGWLVPLTRVSFDVQGTWIQTRERPGFEIDARSERWERALTGAAEVRGFSKTLFGVRGERRLIQFDEGEVFLGTDLHSELSRTSTVGAITVRHELTPLTSVAVSVAREQDRFETSTLRDSDSTRIDAGLTFDPFALISGSALVGYRRFEPRAADLPRFNGMTAGVNLSYVALGSTRLGFQALRDVQYSFDVNQPYYLQTGLSGSIAQQVYGPFEIEGRLGAQKLAYRTRVGASPEVTDRNDRIRSYGGGVGYWLGRDLRLAFNVDQQKRVSDIDDREYEGLRYGISATYGR
jgi:hypothetical protein